MNDVSDACQRWNGHRERQLKMFLRIGIARRKLCPRRRECIAGHGTFITRLALTSEEAAVVEAGAADSGPCPENIP